MTNAEINFLDGIEPTQAEVEELTALIDQLLKLPLWEGKKPHMVLNALLSAYWTASCATGQQARAAHGMVAFGGKYLAMLALAREAETPGAGQAVH